VVNPIFEELFLCGYLVTALKDRAGNIPALLHALETKARVSILDQPEAATNDNGMAEISVKQQVPVTTNTLTGTGSTRVEFHRTKPPRPPDQDGGGPVIDV